MLIQKLIEGTKSGKVVWDYKGRDTNSYVAKVGGVKVGLILKSFESFILLLDGEPYVDVNRAPDLEKLCRLVQSRLLDTELESIFDKAAKVIEWLES